MRKIQLCSGVLQFMDTIDPGNESQSKLKVRISNEYMEIDFHIAFKDQDDNVGSQDRSWRKKLQGGSSEQREAGSFTQTETRTAGSISDCEESKTLNPDPGKKLVETNDNFTFSRCDDFSS